jgi:polyhydroxyalkanoate synthesis regulator phasin
MKKQLIAAGLVVLIALAIGGVAFASNANLEEKRSLVEEKVQAGELSEEEAEEFMQAVQERIAECDGTCDGSGPDEDRQRLGQIYNIGFAYGKGNGNGEGKGMMNGQGNGTGSGICKQAE